MALPLQANSLSPITQLAGNPPKYPRNPTERKRESLVLYIARVPGSRDVILTTMKPRLKNVTAEDVINSLYYLHVDTPNDAFLIEDMHNIKAAELMTGSSMPAIARKPLSETSAAAVQARVPQTVDQGQKIGTTLSTAPSGTLDTQTVMESHLSLRPTREFIDKMPAIQQRPPPDVKDVPVRRPLGPRPYINQPEMTRKPLPGDENIPLGLDTRAQIHLSGLLTGNSNSRMYSDNEFLNLTRTFRQDSNTWSEKPIIQKSFSITLIRRDPSSGAQWNVGKISSESMPSERGSVTEAKSPSNPCSSVLVKLTTPGYGQFRAPLVPSKFGRGSSNTDEPKVPHVQNSFDRQVRMVWLKTWERKYRQHRRSSSDQAGVGEGVSLRSTESSSEEFQRKSTDGGRPDSARYGIQDSGFLSPWNGYCEFSTGTSGRTLKCKHTLTNPSTSSSSTTLPIGISAAVSELRFNFPSSSNPPSAPTASNQQQRRFATSKNSNSQNTPSPDILPPQRAASPRRLPPPTSSTAVTSLRENGASAFPLRDPNPPHPTSDAVINPSGNDEPSDQDDDDYPLSLGREKAGGGIRGRRVKLGKLIVHDEGLKMLDLIVAANMGIWWTVWELMR